MILLFINIQTLLCFFLWWKGYKWTPFSNCIILTSMLSIPFSIIFFLCLTFLVRNSYARHIAVQIHVHNNWLIVMYYSRNLSKLILPHIGPLEPQSIGLYSRNSWVSIRQQEQRRVNLPIECRPILAICRSNVFFFGYCWWDSAAFDWCNRQ